MADEPEDPEAEEFFEDKAGELTERDVWISAQLLVKRHGADATIFAAVRADELLAAGELEGYRAFKRILRAVDELLTLTPPPGTRHN